MTLPTPTRSVLIVTEESNVARELAERLGPMGVTVELASTGQSALRTLARDGTDLVLLELDLPDMSGLEVLRKIRMRRNAPRAAGDRPGAAQRARADVRGVPDRRQRFHHQASRPRRVRRAGRRPHPCT
ncbi:MAG: response regulator [Deltaproteobacteria bacterium]|nr:response regulator [Deltaproteobacteria bacterium]